MAKRLTDKKAAALAAKAFKAYKMILSVEDEIQEYNPNFAGDLNECGIGFYLTDARAALAECLSIIHGNYRVWEAADLMSDGNEENNKEA
jgi:hypothetical protein